MTLSNHLRDIIYTNDYLLDISEELFMTYDWSYELTVERLHTILQHRFVSFKGWCERQVSKISEKVGRDGTR